MLSRNKLIMHLILKLSIWMLATNAWGRFPAMHYLDNPIKTEMFWVKFFTEAVSPNLLDTSWLLNMTVNCCYLPERYWDKNKHAEVCKHL